jgi:hypothetical protein
LTLVTPVSPTKVISRVSVTFGPALELLVPATVVVAAYAGAASEAIEAPVRSAIRREKLVIIIPLF